MATRGQKIKLAMFLVVSALAGVTLLMLFGGARWFKSFDRYYVVVPGSVDGLEKGSTVKLRGVRVGNVAEFDIYPAESDGVKVWLELERGTRIRGGAKAYLKYQGVTGLRLIDINDRAAEGPPLPPGSRIEYGETLVDQLSDRAGELVADAASFMRTAERTLARISETAEVLELERLNETVSLANETLEQLNTIGGALEGILAENRAPVHRTLTRSADTFERAEALLARADRTLERMDRVVLEMSGLMQSSDAQVQATLYNLREASQSFKELGRELRVDPSRLLFSRPPRERKIP